MEARQMTWHIKKDKLDEAAELYEKEVVPAIKKADGHAHVLVMVDPDQSKLQIITMWESHEHREGAKDSGLLQWSIDLFEEHFHVKPDVGSAEHFNVVVHD